MMHVWRCKKWLPERTGQRCTILVCSAGKALYRFDDGYLVVASINFVRTWKDLP